MREILDRLIEWVDRGEPFAVAVVVDTTSSAPREVVAALAISAGGEVAGSVSAGCVEAAVVEMCREAIRTDAPGSATFGDADIDPLAVGLTCGGTVEIFVVPPVAVSVDNLHRLRRALDDDRRVTLTTVLSGDRSTLGTQWVVDEPVDRRPVGASLRDDLRRTADEATRHGVVTRADPRADRVFVHVFAPAPRMVICGAIDLADALGRTARQLGFHVTLVDARGLFATAERFPNVDRVVVDWPHRHVATIADVEDTALCVLTHDEKFDLPLLEWALRQPFAYIGAMGSRAACANRENLLRARGLGADELDRLHSPIGLDIGGATPAETALSIAAEVIAARSGRTGGRLRDATSPVHPRLPGVPCQGLPRPIRSL
ncbi:XdhC family protein [Williamsia sp. M5A3_1d]